MAINFVACINISVCIKCSALIQYGRSTCSCKEALICRIKGLKRSAAKFAKFAKFAARYSEHRYPTVLIQEFQQAANGKYLIAATTAPALLVVTEVLDRLSCWTYLRLLLVL